MNKQKSQESGTRSFAERALVPFVVAILVLAQCGTSWGQDCNRNGIPDACDLSCGAPGGPCDVQGCGTSTDCNGNGIPDECDTTPQDYALNFDGSNDFVTFPADVWFSGDFTIESWVYLRSYGHWARLLDFSNGQQSDNVYAALSGASGGQPVLQVFNGATGGNQVQSGATVPLNQWTHLGFVLQGTTAKIYINGIQTASGTSAVPLSVVRASNWLGRSPWGSDSYANANIDEVRIWNVARTQAQLQSAMNTLLTGSETGLVGYWRMDEGSGQILNDRSPNHRNGVLGADSSAASDDPSWTARGTAPAFPDCNANHRPDSCDIADGTSQDCNNDGIPDSCELNTLVIADSVADFSGVQGQKRWYYGYYSTAFDSNSFQKLTQYGLDTDYNITAWHLQTGSGGFWTALGQSFVAPNGPTSCCGRQNVLQWACRRWLSNRSGTIRLTGHVAKTLQGGNGERARIIVDGTEVWNQIVSGNDTIGISFDLTTPVAYGSKVDFLIDPLSDDGADQSAFIIVIYGGDCNNNGIPDSCDIAAGTSVDCNADGIPDECQFNQDCNGNGINDLCESGGVADCNGNGVRDFCDIAAGTPDCNLNGIPDSCEIAAGTAADCNANGIPDQCELANCPPGNNLCHDCNNDGILDGCELSSTLIADSSADFSNTQGYRAWRYGYLVSPFTSSTFQLLTQFGPDNDFTNSPLTWHLQLGAGGFYTAIGQTIAHPNGSSTNAGRQPVLQWATRRWVSNRSGPVRITGHLAKADAQSCGGCDGVRGHVLVDGVEILNQFISQTDAIGVNFDLSATVHLGSTIDLALDPVGYDGRDLTIFTAQIFGGDCNNNGRPDACDISSGSSADCNHNGVPDECEINRDCNHNGINDLCEPGGTADCDGDGITDLCDIDAGAADCNHNSIPDHCEIAAGTVSDCNNNGIPDACDIASGTSQDCNANGIPDSCDIASGQSTDVNSDGIPDSCQTDIRVVPVITLINPSTTSELRDTMPSSLTAVIRGSTYYVEVWASDIGSTNTGLTGVYVDIAFCGQTTAQQIQHGNTFTVFSSGTIQSGKIDEFGGSTFAAAVGAQPQWARIGWIKMTAIVESASCPITLLQSSSGVAAYNRGDINWAFVGLGSANLTIQAPTKSYDLTGNGVINVGDLSLFSPSWLQSVPPANTAHDFDCDGFVGTADLSWFATGWLKNVTDPTILYPPCATGPGNVPAKDEAQPSDVLTVPDVTLRIVALNAPSPSDTTSSLPASITSVPVGQTYYLELWSSDSGDVNTGLTSVYADLLLPSAAASVLDISHSSIFTLFATGASGPSLVNELGGSALPNGGGIAPQWVKVATVTMSADGRAPFIPYALQPSSSGVAAYGRGAIAWSDISLQGASLRQGLGGDIDGDGDVDVDDLNLLVAVLLGTNTTSAYRIAADFSGDGQTNGKDIPGFITCFLSAGCP